MRTFWRTTATALAALLLAPSCSGCSAGDVLDTAIGFPPTAAERDAEAHLDVEPVLEVLPLPVRDSPTTSATAPSGRFTVPRPAPPGGPSAPMDPEPPVADLEPPIQFRSGCVGCAVERIALAPRRSCPHLNDGTASTAMQVTAGPGSLRVTFVNRGTPDLQALKVGAVSQTLRGAGQPPTVWTVDEDPPENCGEVTLVVRGLESGVRYQAVLVEDTRSVVTGRTVSRQVGTSDAVTVP